MVRRAVIALGLCGVLLFQTAAFSATAYDEALSAYSQGKYKKTITLLQKYVKEKPEAGAYYLLGYSYYKIGKKKEAAKYFGEAYLINPDLNPSKITGEKAK